MTEYTEIEDTSDIRPGDYVVVDVGSDYGRDVTLSGEVFRTPGGLLKVGGGRYETLLSGVLNVMDVKQVRRPIPKVEIPTKSGLYTVSKAGGRLEAYRVYRLIRGRWNELASSDSDLDATKSFFWKHHIETGRMELRRLAIGEGE